MKNVTIKKLKNVLEKEELSGISLKIPTLDTIHYPLLPTTRFDYSHKNNLGMNLTFQPLSTLEKQTIDNLMNTLTTMDKGMVKSTEIASAGMLAKNDKLVTPDDELINFYLLMNKYTIKHELMHIAKVAINHIQIIFDVFEEQDSIIDLWFVPSGRLQPIAHFMDIDLSNQERHQLLNLILSGAFGTIPSFVYQVNPVSDIRFIPSVIKGWQEIATDTITVMNSETTLNIAIDKATAPIFNVSLGKKEGYIITIGNSDALTTIYV